MWIVFFVSCTSVVVSGFGMGFVGRGQWFVLSNLECDDPKQYAVQAEITRRKINRTHDAFSLHTVLDREINDTYGVEVVAYKKVDGGFRFYQRLTDESFCNVCKIYGGDNLPQVLASAKIDPPDCPIQEGDITVNDYVVNYKGLEEIGMYGIFDSSIYLTYMDQRVACTRWLVQFDQQPEEDDDDDY